MHSLVEHSITAHCITTRKPIIRIFHTVKPQPHVYFRRWKAKWYAILPGRKRYLPCITTLIFTNREMVYVIDGNYPSEHSVYQSRSMTITLRWQAKLFAFSKWRVTTLHHHFVFEGLVCLKKTDIDVCICRGSLRFTREKNIIGTSKKAFIQTTAF